MKNEMYYSNKLVSTYTPKIREFIKEIQNVKLENLPEPFLPIHGKTYGKGMPKIIFCGWETRNYRNLKQWVADANNDIENVIYWNEEFLEQEFLKWRTNFGTDFWSFNLKILAALNNIEDWRELYREEAIHNEILSSFVWANIDSIERFQVTAEKLGCNYEDWVKVKNASKRFDNFESLIEIYEPDIIFIEHWDADEAMLHVNIKYEKEEILNENLWYYQTLNKKTEIFWLPHPRGHNSKKIDTEQLINIIINKTEMQRK